MSQNPESVKPGDQIEKVIGQVLSKDDLFLSIDVGSAKDHESGEEYSLSTSMIHQPMVTSKRTRKTWTITWSELVSLAIAAGIMEV